MRALFGHVDTRTEQVKLHGFGHEHFSGAGEIADAFGDAVGLAVT